MDNSLAIIIPAYKSKFLTQTLQSISDQSVKRFNLYVGDDCSPEDIESLCRPFEDKIKLHYHRFPENLGGQDLVGHWNRCVNLIGDEKWIWLFSDDDVLDRTCVEAFYNALATTDSFYDVYRFDTVTIDQFDSVIRVSPESPEVEDTENLAYNILTGNRGNTMPDHIFRKTKYDMLHGFVNFAFAQAADFATSIKFSYPRGLYTIKGPKVRWRYSGDNVSSRAYKIKGKALFGYIEYIGWLVKEFKLLAPQASTRITMSLVLKNFENILKGHYRGIPYSKMIRVSRELATIFGWGRFKALVYCLRVNFHIEKYKLRKFLGY